MIGAYLVDTITLKMHKGTDVYQEPNPTVDVSVAAFIDYGERRLQNESGQVVVSMAKVMMRPRTIITKNFETRADNTISYKDVVVFDGEDHAIVRIAKARDFTVRSVDVYVT